MTRHASGCELILPKYMSPDSHMKIAINCIQFQTIDIVTLSGDSNLGPKCLSLLDFETWGLRPLGHHGRFDFKDI